MDEVYHVYNRGVDKRDIFLEEDDYYRFIHDLFEFNDTNCVTHNIRRFSNQLVDVERRPIGRAGECKERKKREFLVNIIAFCLMPNHFHLLIRPIKDNGLSLFMKKLSGGYTKYFNEKYKRSGALFQGRYKKILIEDPNHFEYLGYYIHCNPLDLKHPTWRKGVLNSSKSAMDYLTNYKWSSFNDYIGNKNFPSVTQRELLQHEKGAVSYKKVFKEWLGGLQEYKEFLENQSINLEK
jgi:putative transposase